jgi:hypothetical protein
MLGPSIGLIHVIIVLAMALAVYWGLYRFTGFPMWMRWIVG